MFGRSRRDRRGAHAVATGPVPLQRERRAGAAPRGAGLEPVVRLPARPEELFRTGSWSWVVQLTDQRIRAHAPSAASVGAVAEAVSQEVVGAAADQPFDDAAVMWNAWADAADVRSPRVLPRLERSDDVGDVEQALRIHADLAALMPQVVDRRLRTRLGRD